MISCTIISSAGPQSRNPHEGNGGRVITWPTSHEPASHVHGQTLSLTHTHTHAHTRAHTHRHTAVSLMRHVNCVVPGLRRRKSLERSYLVLLMQKTPAEWKITQWHCCWKFDCSVGVKSGHGESTALNTHRMSRRKRACLYLINVEKQLGVAFIWNKYFNKYSMFDTLQSTSK